MNTSAPRRQYSAQILLVLGATECRRLADKYESKIAAAGVFAPVYAQRVRELRAASAKR